MAKRLILLLAVIGFFAGWQAAGHEARQTVVLVDTGYPESPPKGAMCRSGHRDFTEQGIKDEIGHSTALAKIIAEQIDIKSQCILIVKWFHSDAHWMSTFNKNPGTQSKYLGDVMNYAANAKNARVINLSAAGVSQSAQELAGVRLALDKGIKVVVAAGNIGQSLTKECDIFPACYPVNHKSFYVVGVFSDYSNYGGPVNYIALQSSLGGLKGTSYAAAHLSGLLMKNELTKSKK